MQNYFFQIIKEKNINYTYFKQIIFIFDDKKIEEINSELIPLLNSFLLLRNEEREKIIMNLDYFNYLIKKIFSIEIFISINDYKIVKNNYNAIN